MVYHSLDTLLCWIFTIIIDINYILRVGGENNNLLGAYYIVYNFNQIYLLILPFLCSNQINADHDQYFSQSRTHQLCRYETASMMALASMNRFDKEEKFNFISQIWGSNIEVPVDNALYILFLLIKIFFTVVRTLN